VRFEPGQRRTAWLLLALGLVSLVPFAAGAHSMDIGMLLCFGTIPATLILPAVITLLKHRRSGK